MSDSEPAAADRVRIARLWGRVADMYDTSIPFCSVLGRRLIDVLDPAPGERLLDVAMGRGACLFPAAERLVADGWVVGLDLSAEMVTATATEIAHRGVRRASVVTGDVEQLGFPAQSFDVVACSQAMNQFPDPTAAAHECRRVLRGGGRIGVQHDVATDPRWQFTNEEYVAFLDRLRAPPEPTRKVDVAAILADAGFTGVGRSEETVEFVFPDEQTWWTYAWTTGAGRRFLEPLPEDARAEYRNAVFDRMQQLKTANGFPFELTIERVIARR